MTGGLPRLSCPVSAAFTSPGPELDPGNCLSTTVAAFVRACSPLTHLEFRTNKQEPAQSVSIVLESVPQSLTHFTIMFTAFSPFVYAELRRKLSS
jgi:hypothetical protein